MSTSTPLERSECWRIKCSSEPEGFIQDDEGTSFEVCEPCGLTLESGAWEQYTPAGETDG